MKLHSDDKKFEVYELHSEDRLLVAIPEEYVNVIDAAIKEYGTIQNVPIEKTVRGIFLNNETGTFELDTEDQENDIVMNQLIVL